MKAMMGIVKFITAALVYALAECVWDMLKRVMNIVDSLADAFRWAMKRNPDRCL